MDTGTKQHTETPFPIATKVTAGTIDGIHTDVAVLGFSNCIVVIVSQLPSIGSIVQSVVTSISGQGHNGSGDNALDDEDSAVEQLSRTPDIPVEIKFVLGNPGTAFTVTSLYQICAIHITQLKHRQNAADSRPIVLGVGLKLPREHKKLAPEEDLDGDAGDLAVYTGTIDMLVGLVSQCRVW
ncbi:hypothetical protein GGI25_000477 [Coemansia spiralis]|uniref:Proteasome assembly chaperone 3 n=2 Tax=Coemansia TaxID=4863 RepID=A0A9W8G7P4_9FUNG|nr:hypothetical protein EDC05_000305 [Coemansia umbellata]KAJ2680841.1 hypothetical protein GGI25_000477 [Coemansia spiralis]